MENEHLEWMINVCDVVLRLIVLIRLYIFLEGATPIFALRLVWWQLLLRVRISTVEKRWRNISTRLFGTQKVLPSSFFHSTCSWNNVFSWKDWDLSGCDCVVLKLLNTGLVVHPLISVLVTLINSWYKLEFCKWLCKSYLRALQS